MAATPYPACRSYQYVIIRRADSEAPSGVSGGIGWVKRNATFGIRFASRRWNNSLFS
ncbi:hypothetical protein KCP78_10970 [Salmonella enterica subsp. enterica]|nr:hypothetical protein KCP78_10970 [Salmonella enterica subsp. enterica]